MAKKAAKGAKKKGGKKREFAPLSRTGVSQDTPYLLMQTFRISGS